MGRGVLGVVGVPPTWERSLLAAVLVVGEPVRVSHLAAARLLGFDGCRGDAMHVSVPNERRRRTPLATVHRTLMWDRIDQCRVGRFTVTTAARTIVDLCALGLDDERLAAAIGSALRDGRTSEAFLRARLAALRGSGRAGIRSLDRALNGPAGHSHLERRFLRLVSAAGFPPPETQVSFRGERVIRVDALWPGARLVVEVMGYRFHCTRADLQRDAQRRNELQEMGNLVLELTSDDLDRRPIQAMARLRRLLARR